MSAKAQARPCIQGRAWDLGPAMLGAATPADRTNEKRNYSEDQQNDADPEEKVQRGDKAAGDGEDYRDDRDDDKQDTHDYFFLLVELCFSGGRGARARAFDLFLAISEIAISTPRSARYPCEPRD